MAGAIGVIGAWVMLAKTGTVPFHGDETGWIRSAYHYTDLLSAPRWTLEDWEGFGQGPWGSLNMQLGKWLLGFPLVAYRSRTGHELDLDAERQTALGKAPEARPPADVLCVARTTSAIVAALVCMVVFLLGAYAQGIGVGVLAAGLTLLTGYFTRWGARAAPDGLYLLFLLLTALAALGLTKARTARDVVGFAALAGVATGLATSVKVTGLPLGLALVAVCLVDRGWLRLSRTRTLVVSMAVHAGCALIVIYGLNPYLWPSVRPQDSTRLIRRIRAQEIANSRTDGVEPPAWMVEGRVSPALRFPLLYFRWKRMMDVQQSRGLSTWPGGRAIGLHRSLFSRASTFPAGGLLILLGMAWGLARAWRSVRARRPDPWLVPIAFFFVNYLFILAFLVLNWDRYYIPTLVAGQLLAAGSIAALARRWTRGRT